MVRRGRIRAVRAGRTKLRFGYIDIIYILLRFVTIAATFFWVFFNPQIVTQPVSVYYLIAVFVLYSLVFYITSLLFPGRFKQLYLWLLVPDIVFITFLIHFTGELQSPFLYGYFLMAGLHAFYYGLYTGLSVASVVTFAYLIHEYHYVATHPVYLGNIFMELGFVWLLAVFGGLMGEKEIKDRQKIEELNEELQDLYHRTSIERDELDVILEGMADGVYTVDTKMKLTSFNKEAENITGWKAKEVIGKKCSEVLRALDNRHEAICGSPACPMEKVIRKGKPAVNFEYLFKTRDGRMINASTSIAPLKHENNEIVGAVTVFRDITRIKEIEQMKSDFVSMVSHELRSPLTSIKGFAATLLREIKFDEATRKKFLGVIESESDRLTRLVEDLLSISRIEEGRFKLERSTFSLGGMVRDIIAVQRERTKKHKFVLKFSAALPPVSADESRIRQVMENLIDNAVKFSPEGGKITVGIKEEAHRFLISIADQGVGIPRTDIVRVFDKFHRVDSSVTRDTGGSGLGLAIAKYIVDVHGGRIWAESKEGKGSTFYFTLPKKVREKRMGKL